MPLLHSFPLAVVPPNTSDDMFPAVGWQTFLGERTVQRFLIFPRWLNDRLSCARFANVPVCNLESDAPTTITDILFGRQLQHNRHLLWASEAGYPDIGGAETDDNAMWSDALVEPTVNNPGAYRTVCVELEVISHSTYTVYNSYFNRAVSSLVDLWIGSLLYFVLRAAGR